MSKKELKVGDQVSWASHGRGMWRTKVGQVSHVVPAGAWATRICPALSNDGAPRDHTSYVVRIPAETPKGRARFYWPRVANLGNVGGGK